MRKKLIDDLKKRLSYGQLITLANTIGLKRSYYYRKPYYGERLSHKLAKICSRIGQKDLDGNILNSGIITGILKSGKESTLIEDKNWKKNLKNVMNVKPSMKT